MPNLKLPQMNTLQIAGRLARDPELKYLPDGKPVCVSSLAQETWNKKDGKGVDFWDIVSFNKTAEMLSECKKGAPVILEGSLGQDHWQDKVSDKPRTRPKITVNRFHVLEWPEKDEEGTERVGSEGTPAKGDDDDSIPF